MQTLPLFCAAGRIQLSREGGGKTCDASGFYWKHDGRVFLITNWHNLTGWDPIRDRALDATTGFVPTHVDVGALIAVPENPDVARRARYKIPLYGEDGKPAWLEHPAHGRSVDVVALELGEDDLGIATPMLNEHPELVDFEPTVGDDVFVLGFPHGLEGPDGLAIWKRGSIATVPSRDIDRLPKLLIDTATRRGMSGSPVLVRRSGIIRQRGVARDVPIHDSDFIGTADGFLGVYSGRIGEDELGVQLGIVWRAEVIDQILDAGVRGTGPFD